MCPRQVHPSGIVRVRAAVQRAGATGGGGLEQARGVILAFQETRGSLTADDSLRLGVQKRERASVTNCARYLVLPDTCMIGALSARTQVPRQYTKVPKDRGR